MTDQSRRQHVPEGSDLARIALRHAREAARRAGLQSGRRTRRPRPGAGRSQPVPLSIMVAELITAMGWGHPETAAVLSHWPELVGSAVADHLKAVGFDPDTGTLTLASESPAWATQARLISKQLTNRVNSAVGSPVVRAVHILRPAPREPITARPPADQAEPVEPVLQAALHRQDAALPQEPQHLFTAGLEAKARPEQADAIRARALLRARRHRPGPS